MDTHGAGGGTRGWGGRQGWGERGAGGGTRDWGGTQGWRDPPRPGAGTWVPPRGWLTRGGGPCRGGGAAGRGRAGPGAQRLGFVRRSVGLSVCRSAMVLAAVRGWALAALALLAPGPGERSRPYAVLQKQNLGKERQGGGHLSACFSVFVWFCCCCCYFGFFKADLGEVSWGAPSNPNLPSSLLPQCCWAASSAPCCSPSSSWPSASTSRSGGGNRAGPGGSVVEKCCWSRLVLPPGTQPSHHLPRPRPGTPRCCRHGSSSTQHCVAPSGMVLHPRDIGGSIVTSLSMTVWPGAGNHTPVLCKLDPWTSRECFRSKPGWV